MEEEVLMGEKNESSRKASAWKWWGRRRVV